MEMNLNMLCGTAVRIFQNSGHGRNLPERQGGRSNKGFQFKI